MKIFFGFLLTLSITLSIMSCNQKKSLTTSEPMNTPSSTPEAKNLAVTFNNDCFKERAVTKEVTDQEMTMVYVMNMYMFSSENIRWQACDVPKEFHTEGLKVKVSGQVLEIKPNERRAGTPFNITALSKM